MTIFILSENHQETAQFLDDKSLDKMIRDIAQVLCNVHHLSLSGLQEWNDHLWLSNSDHIPLLNRNLDKCKWTKWATECKANYLYLVELGLSCCYEYDGRYNSPDDQILLPINNHTDTSIIVWARDNIPDLNSCKNKENRCTPDCGSTFCVWEREYKLIPLIISKKYWHNDTGGKGEIIQSYRNYYQAKLKQKYTNDHENNFDYTKYPSWTNRSKPEWINI